MKSQRTILPLVDLVFLALGGVLACMTQMEVVRGLDVEVSRIGNGAVATRQDKPRILTLSADGMTLDGEPIEPDDLAERVKSQRIVLRADRQLATERTVQTIARLAEAGAEVSIEVTPIEQGDQP